MVHDQWIEPYQVEISNDFINAVGGSPLLAKILAGRGIVDLNDARIFLDPQSYNQVSPFELPGMTEAVQRIKKAIQKQERIGIWGDFDVDGQTSTAILLDSLRKLGADVIYRVPVRQSESHGVSVNNLVPYLNCGVNLLLTCDTGISAHDAVNHAARQGVETIITDHHTLPDELPNALAIVNPRLLPGKHPLSPLCGAGTAFMLVKALATEFNQESLGESYYDLAALGTVADVASLTGENRYIVWRGIEEIRQNARLSIRTILDLNDIQPDWITEEHLGFILSPRLNAVGRLDDANKFVEFLLSEDISFCRLLASQAEVINTHRQFLSSQIFQAARENLENSKYFLENPVLIAEHPGWHSGVIGIAASRLANLYSRPVILIATPPDQPARGSARSVEGIDITSAIAANKAFLLGFGGHPLAAGFSIDTEKIPAFRRGIIRFVKQMRGGEIGKRILYIDAYLRLSEITLEVVQNLERLAPFGEGNPLPKFVSKRRMVQGFRRLGRSGDHLLIMVENEDGEAQKTIWWSGDETSLPDGFFDLAYSVRASNYRGEREVQVEWIGLRPAETISETKMKYKVNILDYRTQGDPIKILSEMKEEGWLTLHEGQGKVPFPVVDRYHLSPSPGLAILTAPPGLSEFIKMLSSVNPVRIALFKYISAVDQLQPFLRSLSGLLRYSLHKKDGWTQVSKLAAAMGQREVTINKGLAWLVARGYIREISRDNDKIKFIEGGVENNIHLSNVEMELISLLKETEAFRNLFYQADHKWFEDIFSKLKGKEAE